MMPEKPYDEMSAAGGGFTFVGGSSEAPSQYRSAQKVEQYGFSDFPHKWSRL